MFLRALIFIMVFTSLSTTLSAVEMLSVPSNNVMTSMTMDCNVSDETVCAMHDVHQMANHCNVDCSSSNFIVYGHINSLALSESKSHSQFYDAHFYHIVHPILTPPPLV